MAAGQFGDLTAGARAAVPFIQSGVARGLSGNRIIAELKAAGTSARRSDVLTIARTIRGERSAGLRVANIRPDFRPDPSRIPVAASPTMKREFTFKVRVDGLGPDGSGVRKGIMVTTDRLLTRREIEDRAREMLDDEDKDYGIEWQSLLIESAFRRGGAFTIGP